MKAKKLLCSILAIALVLSTMGTVTFAADSEDIASSVTANEVTDNGLTFAVEFDGQNQISDYNTWKMDVEFTVNKDVFLEANNSNADGYLSVYLPSLASLYGWRNLPAGGYTGQMFTGGREIKANESLKVLEYYWEDFGNTGMTQNYNDLFQTLKGLKCGVYFTPEFLAENPNVYGEFKLNIYRFDGGAVVETITLASYTFGEKAVAKVGNTEYTSIDEAIANWTNNSTLTLLDDVTLSDVVKLKSTEHHILNLSTYTMKAAEGKNAFEIIAYGTGDAERSAITIKADANNPGTLDAGKKSCIYYDYSKGQTTGNDRPIIKIEGGIFNGPTTSWGTAAGIYTKGSAARKCATLNISGGIFNCAINGSGKSKLLISGGLFNYSVGSQGDSTALRLIWGGTFKTLGFMTADSNNTKFWFGTSMANSNVGLYVNKDNYLVVGGPVITEPDDRFTSVVPCTKLNSLWNSLLQYSSAATYGLYCETAEYVFDKAGITTGNVDIYKSSSADVATKGELVLNCAENAVYDGDVTLKSTTASVKFILADGAAFEGTVTQYDDTYYLVIKETEENGKKVITYTQTNNPEETDAEATLNNIVYDVFVDAINDAVAGDTIKLLKDVTVNIAPQSLIAMFAAREEVVIDLNGKTITPADPTIPTFETDKKYIIINGKIEGDVVNNGGSIELDDVVIEGNVVNEAGNLIVTDATINGDIELNAGEAEITGGTVNGSIVTAVDDDVEVTGGKFTTDPTAYVVAGYDVIRHADYYIVANTSTEAKSISVEFIKTDVENDADNLEGADTYNIVLKANDGDIINELASADLTFAFNPSPVLNGDMAYSIAPKAGITLTQLDDRYMFNYDGVTFEEETASSIVIGTLTVEGYGAYEFSTVKATTNVVNATTIFDNLVNYYVADGDTDDSAATGALVINTDTDLNDDYIGSISTSIAVPTRTLKVTIDFPNAVKDNVADYQNMKVEITGVFNGVNKTVTYNLGTDEVVMGTDGSYVIENSDLVLNNAYTVTVSGAGYRTARYTVTMTGSKELKFWNNVMDEAQVVEIGKDSSAVKVTYLAGDIVKDNKINIYDLSAVVSYFGSASTIANEYVKYDLNRDGVIDSKDVAYVLVSWNN